MNKKRLPVEKEIHLLMAYKDRDEAISEIIAGYRTPKLVKIAAALADMKSHSGKYSKYTEHDLADMLDDVLEERRRRLDADFEWTDENRARFLLISDRLYDASVKAWQEAEETAASLEKRIKKKDSFLKDYEIEIAVTPYPKIRGEREAAVTVALYLAEETLVCMKTDISHIHYHRHIGGDGDGYEENLLTDKSMNWNIEYFNGVFDNDYICYAIHVILDTGVWSFADVLAIERIWADVEVTHQYYT